MNHSLGQHIATLSLILIAVVSDTVALSASAQDRPAQNSSAQNSSRSDAAGSAAKQFVQRALKVNDKNSDGKVTRDEAVRPLKANFDTVDANRDGEITADELTALAKRMEGRQRNRTANNPSRSQPAVPDNVSFEMDIAYRDGNRKWKLDLARPKVASSKPQPAIVFIHGGGWRGGDKGGGQWRSLPLEYASRGYVCVSVNYRLTDEATVLDCIADCKCAVRWLRAHADEYKIDSDRIGAYGNSAGAHLVSVLGLASADARLEGDGPFADESSLVQAVCCSAPPSDFINWRNKNGGNADSALSRLFGDKQVEEVKRRASPVTHVTDKAPPFLIIHGTADTTVPVAQGDALAQALNKASAKDVTYMKIAGADHGVFLKHGEKTRPAMKEFFDRVLRLAE